MREKDQVARITSFGSSAAAVIFFLGFALMATPNLRAEPVAPDSHLPEKARVVAAKFELFKQGATPREVESKRAQVIEYLGSLLKQEAADADLEGALAVRDLIGKVRAEGGAAAKAATGAAPEGLALTNFSLGQKRRMEFAFQVGRDASGASLRCEITGAADDTGDRGLHYELIDPSGKVAKRGFLQSREGDVVTLQTKIAGTWKIAVIDNDTATGGEFPGNNGSVRVSVVRGVTAIASRR